VNRGLASDDVPNDATQYGIDEPCLFAAPLVSGALDGFIHDGIHRRIGTVHQLVDTHSNNSQQGLVDLPDAPAGELLDDPVDGEEIPDRSEHQIGGALLLVGLRQETIEDRSGLRPPGVEAAENLGGHNARRFGRWTGHVSFPPRRTGRPAGRASR